MITRDGLVAEYLFNGNANDTSGNGFHGVVQGATPAADRFGNPNSAYAFDGKNDWIVVSPPPRLTNVELTVSVWARHSATKFERWWHDCIICQDDGDDNDHSRRIFQLSTSGDWDRLASDGRSTRSVLDRSTSTAPSTISGFTTERSAKPTSNP